ncbi:hypothetical protein C922_01659 [Plasmodium inui San Antonio 1]|uniref:Uncharacterized protein n=1 Tax=Plasmodium inui San Antonio 1 TaxID=1237626 RepID=W7A4Q3_9APIC|nr:hypothetical protein C922_01659 [Plasmodium inui San Antonio 1]EUD68047.1 hypothetical protein C922_01659 [Plasmodium inui San Antonio 1]
MPNKYKIAGMARRGLLLHFALFCLSYVAKCKVPNGGYEHTNSRFVQSKINVLTWLTNVIYPSETPKYFKKHLDYRVQRRSRREARNGREVCREYFLKQTYDPVDLNSQWLQTDNWQIDNEKAVIEYKGRDSCRESNHPFPFGWLDNRMSTRTSLIKRDFFCKKTIAQLEVQMNDAQSCGLIFRIVGERNYWGLLIDNKILKLIRVKEGELLVLKEFKELKIKSDNWYVLFAQEVIKDIKVRAGKYGDLSVDYLRKSEDESEYSTAKQGAFGLLANKGNCKFRNIVLRGKKWSKEYEKLKKGTPSLLYNLEEIESLYDNFKGAYFEGLMWGVTKGGKP